MMRITIQKDRLRLDVATETRKAGMMQVASDKQEERLEAQLGGEFSDEAYFSRRCQQGVSDLADVLHKYLTGINYEYASASGDTGAYDDVPRGQAGNNALEYRDYSGQDDSSSDDDFGLEVVQWVLTLSVDSRRSMMPYVLADMCHKYVVYHVLYAWAVMALPSLAAEYKEQQETARLEIQRYVYRKELPQPQQ